MNLIWSGFLLIFCTLTSASPVPGEGIDIFVEMANFADGLCHDAKLVFDGRDMFFRPTTDDISFELRTSCRKSQYVVSEADKLRDSPDFDVNKKTVVFVSGWRSKMDASYTSELTQAYNCRGGHNLIVVNTKDYIKSLNYLECAFHTKYLGHSIAMGLQKLNIPAENIHLIGHSLGAHIMGSAGNKFYDLTGTKVGRITGLDPARPCYVNDPVFEKLKADNAAFVDIIHSNSNEAGIEEAIGHVDFYPGGLMSTQPSCAKLDIQCSHAMSIRYYTESVYKGNEQNFVGTQCQNRRSLTSMQCDGTKQPMGFAADKNAKGVHYLGVEESAPYGRNARRNSGRKSERCGKCKK